MNYSQKKNICMYRCRFTKAAPACTFPAIVAPFRPLTDCKWRLRARIRALKAPKTHRQALRSPLLVPISQM